MASSNVSSVTNHFSTANEGFTTTSGGSILSGAATVPLTSATGLTNGKIFVGIIEPGGTKEQTFTGVVDTAGAQITGVVWTRGANADHGAGVTIVDYVSGTGHNMMTKGLLVAHNQDGTHATNMALTSPKVLTSVNDTNNNELFKVTATGSAVNELTVANAATGGTPSLTATGGDTDIFAGIFGKGSAGFKTQYPYRSNTTNSYPNNLLVQFGWGYKVGGGGSQIDDTVTFPIAYSATPLLFLVTYIGYKNGSDPSAITDFSMDSGVICGGKPTNSTTAAVHMIEYQAAAIPNTSRQGYQWLAIGVKT